jgi:thiol-disulfide isomerase/thioredoxin
VLLNFWATWCPACRAELPALQAAYERYGDQVSFLAVDVKESRDIVASFVSELGLAFPVLIDDNGAVSDRLYQVRGIPTSLFIARDGVVTARHVGPLTEADIDHYLMPLLAEVPASKADESPIAKESENQSEPAPDFTLDSAKGTPVTLSRYRDKSNVVLIFYRGQT